MPGRSTARQVSSHPDTQPLFSSASLHYGRGGTIVAFAPSSEGDALRQHMLEMLEPLRPSCSEIVIVDLLVPESLSQLAKLGDRPTWFAISPFGVGERFPLGDPSGASPWAAAGIPFVRLFGDSPAYFPIKHVPSYNNSINAYGHIEHQEFFGRWFSRRNLCLTLPLFPFDRVPVQAVDVARKVSGARIIFPKNGNNPDQLIDFWRRSLPPGVAQALEAVARSCAAAPDQPMDFVGLLCDHFAEFSLDLAGNRRLLFFLTAQLDDYLRRYKSTLIARALLDFPVTIRGRFWDHVEFRGRRAMLDGDSDYSRTRSLIDSALAVVDMSPNTHRGAHDRTLRAAGRYTAFLTNRQQFFVENFPAPERFTFDFSTDSIRDCIDRALSRPQETVEMGIEQGERMRAVLTEARYVEQLTAAIDACTLGCAGRPAGTQNFVDYSAIPD